MFTVHGARTSLHRQVSPNAQGVKHTSGISPTILALHGTDPHAVCIGFNCEVGTHDHVPKDNLGETLAACHKCGGALGGAVSFEPGIARREGAPHRFSNEVASTLRSDMGDNLPAVATVECR